MLQAAFGVFVFVAIAWLLSEDRRALSWRLVLSALALQLALAIAFLRFNPLSQAMYQLNNVVGAIERATVAGSGFVFGFLGGANAPFAITDDSATYILAFRVLPQILVFSVLVAVLWHWRILPTVVRGLSWGLTRALNVGGAVALAAAGSIFLGMVEAPLMIRAYLRKLTASELFTVMTCGMSTVAGSVMILYTNVLKNVLANPLGLILTASVIAVPGAIMISRIMVPIGDQQTGSEAGDASDYRSTMDAVARGTQDGIRLVVNVGAMLIVLVALVALLNGILSSLPNVNDAPLTLQRALGWVFAPVAWLMGIPAGEAQTAGALLGTKVVLNELVAYLQFGAMGPSAFVDRTDTIITFALCGFANLGSLGIMIGGLTTLCPERQAEILRLAPRSVISGTLVNCLSGAIVGIVY